LAYYVVSSGVVKGPAEPRHGEHLCQETQKYSIGLLKYVAHSFGLYSVLLTESSILDPCYEIWG
jgi:hypothetical protein